MFYLPRYKGLVVESGLMGLQKHDKLKLPSYFCVGVKVSVLQTSAATDIKVSWCKMVYIRQLRCADHTAV